MPGKVNVKELIKKYNNNCAPSNEECVFKPKETVFERIKRLCLESKKEISIGKNKKMTVKKRREILKQKNGSQSDKKETKKESKKESKKQDLKKEDGKKEDGKDSDNEPKKEELPTKNNNNKLKIDEIPTGIVKRKLDELINEINKECKKPNDIPKSTCFRDFFNWVLNSKEKDEALKIIKLRIPLYEEILTMKLKVSVTKNCVRFEDFYKDEENVDISSEKSSKKRS